jgi:hypothetical protein
VRPEDVPGEYRDLIDQAAGKTHSATGAVMTTLAQILTLDRAATEARVRAQVGGEIETATPEVTVMTSTQVIYQANGMRHAARIARGEGR